MISKSLIQLPKAFKEILGREIDSDLVVSTDTRNIADENAFICLYGENFDAHSMLENIVEHSSIKVIIAEKKRTFPEVLRLLVEDHKITFVLVEDIFVYIRELASECVKHWKVDHKKIIGLTGSAGKTSSKEALFHILNSVFPGKVLATKGNLNNHIGVPLTLFRLTEEHDFAIVEMGTNAPSEIRLLAETALPDTGLITNVGAAHLERLIDLEGVFKEKSSLYHVINETTEGNGIVILPSDDIYLNRLKDFPGVITFGRDGHYKVSFTDEGLELSKGNSSWLFTNEIVEHHLLKNLAQAFILLRTMFSEKTNELFEAALTYSPKQKNRSEVIETQKHKIYLDAYNANPLSMKVAIDTFERLLKREGQDKKNSLLILGDMKELGTDSIRFHEELGEYIHQKNFENIFFVGEMGVPFERRLENVKKFSDVNVLIENLKSEKIENKYILIKASRSLALEKLIDYFQ
jgi:UDP-N-acetylmuramoyl-tripeptide--D-alanyl-D-alanine ligase